MNFDASEHPKMAKCRNMQFKRLITDIEINNHGVMLKVSTKLKQNTLINHKYFDS